MLFKQKLIEWYLRNTFPQDFFVILFRDPLARVIGLERQSYFFHHSLLPVQLFQKLIKIIKVSLYSSFINNRKYIPFL